MELLPLNYYFSLSYQGGTEQTQQNVASNQTVSFQTRLVTIDFQNSYGQHSLTGTNLIFYSDMWRTFGSGSTTNGIETMELLPLNYYFGLSYEGGSEQKLQNIAVNQTVPFQTSLVTIDVRDDNNNALAGTNLQFYSDTWRTFGSGATTGGQESMELLPLNYYFSLTYLGNAYQKIQNVGLNALLSYVFNSGGMLLRNLHNTTSIAAFSFSPNPAVNNLNISMPASGSIEIRSIDGKKLAQYNLKEGNSVIDVTSLPVGNHVIIINYNGTFETHKFVKQ